MKIISNKKYNEWKDMELKYAALETAQELSKNEKNELLKELDIAINNNKNLKKEVFTILDTNRELGFTVDETKKEIRRLKTLLTKNNISYKKENK